MAWLAAGATVLALIALPVAVDAQGNPRRAGGPSGAPSGGSVDGRGGGFRGSSIDLFDYRDAIANSMVIAPADLPGSRPLTTGEVVCLAGCDKGPGSVVYRDQPKPFLASVTAPQPMPRVVEPLPAPQQPQQTGLLSCLAGCYEPPKGRTIASLREQAVANRAPVRVAAHARPTVANDAAPALPVTSERTDAVVPTATNDKPTANLRSAFAPTGAPTIVKSAKPSTRARRVARGNRQGNDYGKVVVVPTTKPAATPTIAPAPVAAVSPQPAVAPQPAVVTVPREAPVAPVKSTPAERAAPIADATATEPLDEPAKASDVVKNNEPAKSETPVTRYTPPSRPERRRPDQAKPQAAASNDWFNSINRERREKEAAEKARIDASR